MVDEMIPVNWYAVVGTGPHSIEPYLVTLELLADPRLLPFQQDGQKLGKLIYSGFAGYEDYEGVLSAPCSGRGSTNPQCCRSQRSLPFLQWRCVRDRAGGADAYVLSNFLVIWEDDRAVIPLRNCRKAKSVTYPLEALVICSRLVSANAPRPGRVLAGEDWRPAPHRTPSRGDPAPTPDRIETPGDRIRLRGIDHPTLVTEGMIVRRPAAGGRRIRTVGPPCERVGLFGRTRMRTRRQGWSRSRRPFSGDQGFESGSLQRGVARTPKPGHPLAGLCQDNRIARRRDLG